MIVNFQFTSPQEKLAFLKTAIGKELMKTDFSSLNPFYRRMLIMRMFLLPPVPFPVTVTIDGEPIKQ